MSFFVVVLRFYCRCVYFLIDRPLAILMVDVMKGRIDNVDVVKAQLASADEAVRLADRELEGVRANLEKEEAQWIWVSGGFETGVRSELGEQIKQTSIPHRFVFCCCRYGFLGNVGEDKIPSIVP